jgi:hypothetical protein
MPAVCFWRAVQVAGPRIGDLPARSGVKLERPQAGQRR